VYRLTKPLRFYGYISYGCIYFISSIQAFQDLFVDFHHVPAELTVGSVLLRFGGVLAVTTAVCFLSRRYFEEFFLRLKDRLVPYVAPTSRHP